MSVPKELPATLNSRTMSLPNAFVTLLTTPSYLPGALVLLHSLYDLHPEPRDFKIVCLVTPETVDARTIGELRKAGFDFVIGVEPIGSGRPGTPALDLLGTNPFFHLGPA
jgi:glycogenin glucosyltransferase